MSTIYVVTSGSYSDYSIRGVYTTRERAERGMELRCPGDGMIEEYEADETPEAPDGYAQWCVQMDRDGATRSVMKEPFEQVTLDDKWCPYGDNRTVDFYMLATDQEHAVKIANERRTQLIATGEWTADWNAWRKQYKGW